MLFVCYLLTLLPLAPTSGLTPAHTVSGFLAHANYIIKGVFVLSGKAVSEADVSSITAEAAQLDFEVRKATRVISICIKYPLTLVSTQTETVKEHWAAHFGRLLSYGKRGSMQLGDIHRAGGAGLQST